MYISLILLLVLFPSAENKFFLDLLCIWSSSMSSSSSLGIIACGFPRAISIIGSKINIKDEWENYALFRLKNLDVNLRLR